MSMQQNFRVHHPHDEAHLTWSHAWHPFKLQEEEQECKDNYVPELSALCTNATRLEVDPEMKVYFWQLLSYQVKGFMTLS